MRRTPYTTRRSMRAPRRAPIHRPCRAAQHTIPRRGDAQLALGARTVALLFEIEPPLNVTAPSSMRTTPPTSCAPRRCTAHSRRCHASCNRPRTPSADTRPTTHPGRPTRTSASVPDIATPSNSAVPLPMESTPPPPLICTRAHRAAARQPQQPGLCRIEQRTRSTPYNASHGNGAAGRLRGADATQADATQADATGADATRADATGADATRADATGADATCNARRCNLPTRTDATCNARRCNLPTRADATCQRASMQHANARRCNTPTRADATRNARRCTDATRIDATC